MVRCYICNDELTEKNESCEHIFLNSIGGKLKSNKLVCAKCNSDFGNDIDCVFSQQFDFFCSMLNIKRDRGKPQTIIGKNQKSGETILMKPGGIPTYSKPQIEETINEKGKKCIHLVARTEEEAKKIIKGYCRKYPQLNYSQILKNSKRSKEYFNDKFLYNFSIGGNEAFRSICKTATNFYMLNNGERKNILHLIPYIKNGQNKCKLWYFYPQKEIIPKNGNQIVHSIILVGNPDEKILYSYIEFFNAFKFLVLLNDNYTGKHLQKSYKYDVINRIEIENNISLNLSSAELNTIFTEQIHPTKIFRKELTNLLHIICNKLDYESINSMSQNALKTSLLKYPEGTLITEEMIIEKLLEEVTPWLMHLMRNNK